MRTSPGFKDNEPCVAGMNKFRRTGKGGVLYAPGGTLIAADTLCCIRASPTHALSYLCLHRFDDYVDNLQAHECGLGGAMLDSRPEER
jgi:hypothetical protein